VNAILAFPGRRCSKAAGDYARFFLACFLLAALCMGNSGAAQERIPSYCPAVPAKRPAKTAMTPHLAKLFLGPEVRQYIVDLAAARKRSNLAGVHEPPEYSDLISAGKEAVPFLLKELRENDVVRRGAAYEAISRITHKSFWRTGFPDLLQVQPDVERYEEWWALNKGKSRIQWLIDDVASEDQGPAEGAITWLAYDGDSTALPALRKALSNDALRPSAVEALAELGDKTAVPYLIDSDLADEDVYRRRMGICYLIGLTGKSFAFDPSGTPESRKAAIEKWKAWWQTEGESK
jgi:HEAT repeat protein